MKYCVSLYTLLILLSFSLLLGCEQADDSEPKGPAYKKQAVIKKTIYHLAVHPLHNPQKLSKAYQPLIDHLNKNIPSIHFDLEASRDYQAYEVKFRQRLPHIILPNPWQTLEAMKVGYNVIAMAGEAKDFKGIFIVKRDTKIKSPIDLKGKIVSYPSHTALAASIMPQRYLHDNGVNITQDIENRYVGSQESSIMNVLIGKTSAGATWPPPWRLFQKDRPEDAAKLKVIWETPSLLNNSVMVRDDVKQKTSDQIKKILSEIHTTEAGKIILKGMETARFFTADNAFYEPVREFINNFEKEVRLVEQP